MAVKYVVVLLVVGLVLWLMLARGQRRGAERPPSTAPKTRVPAPLAMAECAHCGLHLPASDAVVDGSRVYCSQAHRLRGPQARPPAA